MAGPVQLVPLFAVPSAGRVALSIAGGWLVASGLRKFQEAVKKIINK